MLKIISLMLFSTSVMAANFSLTSQTLKNGGTLPLKNVFNSFGCSGQNISPELAWKNAPAATKSFAINVFDPDAPTGSGFWHWTAFNIPVSVSELAEGASADKSKFPVSAVQGRTDFGKPGYGGACPPPGKPHRYIFTVYALKVESLPLTEEASGAMVGFYLGQNSLAKASLTVKYGR